MRTVSPLRRRMQGECIVPLLMTTFLAFIITLVAGFPVLLPQVPSTPIAFDPASSENRTRFMYKSCINLAPAFPASGSHVCVLYRVSPISTTGEVGSVIQ